MARPIAGKPRAEAAPEALVLKPRQASALAEYAFLLDYHFDEPALLDEINRARSAGLPLRRLLIGEGSLDAEDYVAALAMSLDIPYFPSPANAGLKTRLEPDHWRGGWATGRLEGEPWIVLDGTFASPRGIEAIANSVAARGFWVGLASPADLRLCVLASSGPALLRQAVSGLSRNHPGLSARASSGFWQAVTIASIIGLLTSFTVIAGISAQSVLTALLTLPFLVVVLFRAAVLLAYPWARPRTTRAMHSVKASRDLPVYTLLVPLYREAAVLPGLIEALRALDYPAAKLDIKLILESVDAETIAAVRRLELRPPFDVIIVPDRAPRSKPKALNYALNFARGDFVCVFDAEDVPDPGQLKRALAAFSAGGARLGCVQGRLAIDNTGAGWLCRQFALEYLTLFDGLLPALDHLALPLPLGGTSNHFPAEVLHRVGAWDAWNVTEDADLGLRLYRSGYRCQVMASTTWEEAPHQVGNWLRQRTRWQKGWIQTYLVHNQRPWRLLRQLGLWRWFGVQAQFGGVILSSLLYPVTLALLAVQLALGWPFLDGEPGSGRVMILLAFFNLLAGLGVPLAHSALCALARGRWRLLMEVPLMPIYWLLISLAAYRALVQLARDPFLWEKTEHGKSRRTAHPRMQRHRAAAAAKSNSQSILHS